MFKYYIKAYVQHEYDKDILESYSSIVEIYAKTPEEAINKAFNALPQIPNTKIYEDYSRILDIYKVKEVH